MKELEELAETLKTYELAVNQLEEATDRINKNCKEILDIMHNPFRLIMEFNKIEELNLRIQAESAILANFANALADLNVDEEGEE